MTTISAGRSASTGTDASDDASPAHPGVTAARTAISYLLMSLLSLLFLAPILYMVIGSLKPSAKVLNGLGGFAPTDLSAANYTNVIDRLNSPESGYFLQFYATSTIVATVIVAGGRLCAGPAEMARPEHRPDRGHPDGDPAVRSDRRPAVLRAERLPQQLPGAVRPVHR
jgi:hypothetical protein